MDLSRETNVGDIVSGNPEPARVLEEAGLEHCCGGNRPVSDACVHAGASSEEIVTRLRRNAVDVGPADANWISAPLGSLTEHIRVKHHRYVREAIPRVEALVATVKAQHGEKHPEIGEIERLFRVVGKELIMHMQKEEQILFPYIEKLEKSVNGNGVLEPPFFQTVRNPIHAMMKEHDAAGDRVEQIRKLSLDCTPPAGASASYAALYQGLEEFEADLHLHVRLENNVLFPRAVEMEGTPA